MSHPQTKDPESDPADRTSIDTGNIPFHRLIRHLATGSAASVWEAEHTMLGQRVALKVSLPLSSTASRNTVILEGRLGRIWQHRSLIRVFDVGLSGSGLPYVSMQLGSMSLNDRMSDGLLSWSEVAQVLTSLREALGIVHAAGLVHCDIKPSNIIAMPRGTTVQWCLADFGLAREQGSIALPGTGSFGFAAPELTSGLHVDARADQFSLGILVRSMISLCSDAAGLDEVAIEWAIRRATSHEPRDRFATPTAFLDAVMSAGPEWS